MTSFLKMTFDEHFDVLPKNEPILYIWRIEKFELNEWKDTGAFHTGDAYLIYHAYRPNNRALVRDIYFWLGSECTQDESGTAAIKAVNLDDYFGGSPIQHREVQYHESEAFNGLFEKYGGIRYLDGGIDSGFTKVEREFPVNLYQIKGKRHPVLQQVPPTGESLNQGDVFILHYGEKLFGWYGKSANRMEKMKGSSVISRLKESFRKPEVVIFDKGETNAEFWELLGGEVPIKEASEGGEDDAFEKKLVRRIYLVENGPKFTLMGEGARAQKSVLKPEQCFIINQGTTILVWTGRSGLPRHKKNMMSYGMKFQEEFELPTYSSIQEVIDGTSNADFDLIWG